MDLVKKLKALLMAVDDAYTSRGDIVVPAAGTWGYKNPAGQFCCCGLVATHIVSNQEDKRTIRPDIILVVTEWAKKQFGIPYIALRDFIDGFDNSMRDAAVDGPRTYVIGRIAGKQAREKWIRSDGPFISDDDS